MTNKEAINLISKNKSVFKHDAEMTEALDLAIKALEEDRYGEGYAEGFLSGSSCADWRNDV